MVTFGEITNKTLRVKFTKEDLEGYNVEGGATYNKEDKLVDANGEIKDEKYNRIANFNTYGEGEYARINLTDCLPDKMTDAVMVAEATLADLAATYPNE
jgi:hypothetical protein